MVNAQRKFMTCERNPISGGPTKKPRNPIVETAANAVLAGIVLDLPANPYTIGTTDDTPNPTMKNPAVAVNK